jgi:ribosome-associated toxin RatA of RatAB toxin-antitoxin module
MREVTRSALIARPPGRIYALITDIEKYPSFVPWCTHARIESRDEHEIVATLGIRRGPLHTEFTTRNVLEPVHGVRMQLVKGPFRTLEGAWRITPVGAAGSEVELSMRFAFASSIVGALLEPLFEETAATLLDAFIAQARADHA